MTSHCCQGWAHPPGASKPWRSITESDSFHIPSMRAARRATEMAPSESESRSRCRSATRNAACLRFETCMICCGLSERSQIWGIFPLVAIAGVTLHKSSTLEQVSTFGPASEARRGEQPSRTTTANAPPPAASLLPALPHPTPAPTALVALPLGALPGRGASLGGGAMRRAWRRAWGLKCEAVPRKARI